MDTQLDRVLSGTGMTLLAPMGVCAELKFSNWGTVRRLMLNGTLLAVSMRRCDLRNPLLSAELGRCLVTTLQARERLELAENATAIMIGGAQLRQLDLRTSDGWVQLVDAVPKTYEWNVLATMRRMPQLSNFVRLIELAPGLEALLRSPLATVLVFAPLNDRLERNSTLWQRLVGPRRPATLLLLTSYHISFGTLHAQELSLETSLHTLANESVCISADRSCSVTHIVAGADARTSTEAVCDKGTYPAIRDAVLSSLHSDAAFLAAGNSLQNHPACLACVSKMMSGTADPSMILEQCTGTFVY